MMKKRRRLFSVMALDYSKRHRVILTGVTIALFPLVYVIVYFTGGTQYAYLHIVYIPVLFSALLYGWKGGLVVGIAGGILVGPLMPFDTAAGIMQDFYNWFYRLLFIVLLGMIAGISADNLKQYMRRILTLHSHNVDTGLINYNYYIRHRSLDAKRYDNVTLSIQINNYSSLIVLLGRDDYFEMFRDFYNTVKRLLPGNAWVFQVDVQRLWVELSMDSFERVRDHFPASLDEKGFNIDNIPLYVDYSIGLSLPASDKKMHQRFKESDVAAMHAERSGLKYVVYHESYEYDKVLVQRLGALPKAIENNEFFLEYQPVFDLESGKVVSLEALLRWRHGDEVLYPDEFIPLAEETRIIDDITRWVLSQVVRDMKQLEPINDRIHVAFNISLKNLYNDSLIRWMKETIDSINLEHRWLYIEMTESTMMKDSADTKSFLDVIKQSNVKTVLDDFGTGYSSLACLRDLPVDAVKIDREFTLNIKKDETLALMVRKIIELAHEMKLDVIAEGVEDKQIVDALSAMGCDYAQGFYYAKGMPMEDFIQWLKASN